MDPIAAFAASHPRWHAGLGRGASRTDAAGIILPVRSVNFVNFRPSVRARRAWSWSCGRS